LLPESLQRELPTVAGFGAVNLGFWVGLVYFALKMLKDPVVVIGQCHTDHHTCYRGVARFALVKHLR